MKWQEVDVNPEIFGDQEYFYVHVNMESKHNTRLKGISNSNRLLKFELLRFFAVYETLRKYAMQHNLYCSAHFQCGCVKLIHHADFTDENLFNDNLDVVCDDHFIRRVLDLDLS
jgi:hypothetical protein